MTGRKGTGRPATSATIHFDPQPEADFDRHCAASASALHELGIGTGDVVALMLHNEPVLLELMLAVRCVGAYYCLINWNFKTAGYHSMRWGVPPVASAACSVSIVSFGAHLSISAQAK